MRTESRDEREVATTPSRFAITPARFRWFALANFIGTIAITLTGGLVRLTGSGLGCPDWPTCERGRLSAPLAGHTVIEYGNRMVTGALVIVIGASFVASLLRIPRRRDLVGLCVALVGGVVANAVLGGLVVYSKLNPWLVSLHFVLSLAMVVLAAVLYHHSKYRYGAGAPAVVRDARFKAAAYVVSGLFGAVVLAGTVATGSGPHPGNSQGQHVARRLPIAFSQATWIHSVTATAFVALVIGLLLAVWWSEVPTPLRLGVRRLALIASAQAVIGVTQYFTHVPVVLVELHIVGATSLAIGVTQFSLRQVRREREAGTRRTA